MAFDQDRAVDVQLRLRRRCTLERAVESPDITLVGGVDAAYQGELVWAAAVVMSYPLLGLVECAEAAGRTRIPYIPGLFAFREAPLLIKAVRNLHVLPDILIVNGHGIAHPRGFGIASHVGVLLDIPTIGVSERLVAGSAETPAPRRGAVAPVRIGGRIAGMAVRTQAHTRPVFVSPGHRTDTAQAAEIVLATSAGHRLPEPLRRADQEARSLRRAHAGG